METEDINFFGYKKYAKKWNEEDEEVRKYQKFS